jgi:DNA adenine methylase
MMNEVNDNVDGAQTVVPQTGSLLPPRANCTAPIKWVGGKRWLVPTIAPSIYERLAATGGHYIEPFMGSGAVALDLGLPGMILGDVCKPLVSTYTTIRKSAEAVAWALKTLVERGTDKESYLAVRASEPTSIVFAAARFIYLNKFGFNGLYRENSKGKFNVPHGGDRTNTRIPDLDTLNAVANALKGADIRVADFRQTIDRANEGDVLYVDSPYYETFSDYTAGGFSDDDHAALSTVLRSAHERGVVFIASNSDHERVRELYDWATVVPVHERHAVGATGDRRGMKAAVLILSDESILRGA